jgi:hypothetical protein
MAADRACVIARVEAVRLRPDLAVAGREGMALELPECGTSRLVTEADARIRTADPSYE